MKKTLDNVNLKDKIVLARFDLNVPFDGDKISDSTRIIKCLSTIKEIMKSAKNLIILSHLGRIKKEKDKEKLSLRIVANELKERLKEEKLDVVFESSTNFEVIKRRIKNLTEKQIIVLENTRFYDVENEKILKKESKCDKQLAAFWASLCQIFVNDAFGTAHRKHASNYGISLYVHDSVIGRLVEKELTIIEKVLNNPQRPFVAILGGAKVSDKLGILSTFLKKADKIIIGGGMAYTFMVAKGLSIGNSLVEKDRVELTKKMLQENHQKIILPVDNIGTTEFSNETKVQYFEKGIPEGSMGLDIGDKSISLFKNTLKDAKTIIWNGPMGVFEFSNYEKGTLEIAKTVGKLNAFSIIGGGDSVAAVNKLDLNEYKFNHISTGGGALLTLLEGKELVGLSNIKDQ